MNSRPHYLERIRYWQGQRLRHTDLQSQLESSEQLRWWHNRVHDAYGIGEGLTVTLTDDTSQVKIAPGVAYDAFGRELFLFAEKKVYFPEPTGMAQYLIASFQPPTGTEPLIHWKPAAWFQVHDGAILARQAPTGELVSDGQKVRAMKRPYIGYGATIPGNTAWEYWKPDDPLQFDCSQDKLALTNAANKVSALRAKIIIDTTASGFTKVPHYFATLQGHPIPERVFLNYLYHFVACCSQNGFVLYVYMNYVEAGPTTLLQALIKGSVWVSWIGIEPFLEEGAPV